MLSMYVFTAFWLGYFVSEFAARVISVSLFATFSGVNQKAGAKSPTADCAAVPNQRLLLAVA